MADTGCQSCLAGTATMKRLGLTTKDLLPVRLKMRAANDSPITILGAILIRLAEPQGKRSTTQMVYITDHVDKIFLSQEACADLGIIPTGFPPLAATLQTTQTPPTRIDDPPRTTPTRIDDPTRTHQGHAHAHNMHNHPPSLQKPHSPLLRRIEASLNHSSSNGTRPAPSTPVSTSPCPGWMDPPCAS